MKRSRITQITRIVFLIWLIVTAVLLWQIARRPARTVPGVEIGAWSDNEEIAVPVREFMKAQK